MKLHEYASRQILARHAVPLLPGELAADPDAAVSAAARLGLPVVVKAQVLAGGRGKAGGVRLATTSDEVAEHATDILALRIGGMPVRQLLITPAVDIAQEYYLGLVLDRAARAVTVVASAAGGVEIEEAARLDPQAVLRLPLHPLLGLQAHNVRTVAFFLGLPAAVRSAFGDALNGLAAAFFESDADLAEINPLALTQQGELLALDAKVVLDDSALARHPDLDALRDLAAEDAAESAAREAGISFIKLDGSIGCMVNGAGLAMTTMDLIKLAGGEPANFLDIGGGARAERVAAAFRIILADPHVRAILINIFGGITRGDEVARGIIEARAVMERDVPLVVRVVGTNADEAAAILRDAKLMTAANLDEAARLAVAAAGAAG